MSIRKLGWSIAALAFVLVLVPAAADAQGVLFVKNDRVGIGVADPLEKPLHIVEDSGTIGAGFFVQTTNAPASKNWYFFQNHVTGAFLISNFPNGAAQFQVFPDQAASTFVVRDGGVGIGTQNPGANKFNVAAGKTTIADAWTVRSSKRYKTDIQAIDDALEKITQLRGVSYTVKSTGQPSMGLIAEEVGEVLPALVTYEENGLDAVSLDYDKLSALLIEAVKAQQAQITELRRQLAER